jgi:hypothetical protein
MWKESIREFDLVFTVMLHNVSAVGSSRKEQVKFLSSRRECCINGSAFSARLKEQVRFLSFSQST